MKNKTPALQFPCTYPLKVMGRNTNEFDAKVRAIIEKHIPEGDTVTYQTRASSGAKYLSLTATFSARSQVQLAAIYRELNQHELVLMTL